MVIKAYPMQLFSISTGDGEGMCQGSAEDLFLSDWSLIDVANFSLIEV